MKIDTVDEKTYFEAPQEDFEVYCEANRIVTVFMDDYEKAEMFNKMYPAWHICTLIEAEGKWLIIQGCHFVNRMGYYFLSKKIYPEPLEKWLKTQGIKTGGVK